MERLEMELGDANEKEEYALIYDKTRCRSITLIYSFAELAELIHLDANKERKWD